MQWALVRCTASVGYPCPRGGTFGLLVVSTFVPGSPVTYRRAVTCAADCEDECLRHADCVGFSTTLILLGRGSLSTTANARCGTKDVPCPSVQMQFWLPADCDGAFDDTLQIDAHGVTYSSALENCTISVSARATQPDAWMTVPRIGAPQRKNSTNFGLLFGLLIPAFLASVSIAIFLHLF